MEMCDNLKNLTIREQSLEVQKKKNKIKKLGKS